MAEDVRNGLSERPRELHPKYFYDQHGSELFDQICDTPEYYLTRTEDALLDDHAAEILAIARPDSMLELGSGTSRKTRKLLDHWQEPGAIYWPFDVSAEMLETVAGELTAEYPHLDIHGLVGDYTAGFGHFPELRGRSLALFLGSTLGNFAPDFARNFLTEFVTHLDAGDYFLLGADLDKDPAILTAAYNDAAGITAAFNKNVLTVINRRLKADFDTDRFVHRGHYNGPLRQMEMYLESTCDQNVRIDALDMDIDFAAGESILTEISRKFLLSDLHELLRRAGLTVVKEFVADKRPYALVLAVK